MAEEAAAAHPKWEGKATAELMAPTADQVWPLLADFCGLHKWLPSLAACEHVGGPHGGQLGEIRRCSTAVLARPAADGGGGGGEAAAEEALWAEEELVAIDPAGRTLSYKIVANNIGFRAYRATMKVEPSDGGDGEGCKIEWSFVCDPIEGMRFEDFMGQIDSGAKAMAKRMQEALRSA